MQVTQTYNIGQVADPIEDIDVSIDQTVDTTPVVQTVATNSTNAVWVGGATPAVQNVGIVGTGTTTGLGQWSSPSFGSTTFTTPGYQTGIVSHAGVGGNLFVGYNSKGEEVCVIGEDGEFHTIVQSLVGKTKAKVSDSYVVRGERLFLWDILQGLPGVEVVGRILVFDQAHANAIELYAKMGDDYAGMTAREFVQKIASREKAIKAKPVHMKWYPCGVSGGAVADTAVDISCKRCRKSLYLDKKA